MYLHVRQMKMDDMPPDGNTQHHQWITLVKKTEPESEQASG